MILINLHIFLPFFSARAYALAEGMWGKGVPPLGSLLIENFNHL